MPEPKEWEEYVLKGDLHPQKTLWSVESINSKYKSKSSSKSDDSIVLEQRRHSQKQKSHMNFIEAGKKRQR